MDATQKYWAEVARRIALKAGGEPPKHWNKARIDAFLLDFHQQLDHICRSNAQKAALCGATAARDGEIQSPSISYHSFRRIFITQESTGNRSTREMFAIYLGFDSLSDFLVQNDIVSAVPLSATALPRPFFLNHRLYTLAALLFLSALAACWFWQRASGPQSRPGLLIRNEKGIALLDIENDTAYQVIHTESVIGIDFDPATRMLFWANGHRDYRCLSCAQLDVSLRSVVRGTFVSRLTPEMKLPAGIVLDPVQQLIYCADHWDSTIVVFDYKGHLLNPALAGKMSGGISSVKLDPQNQVLYWTDIKNHRIGRMFLATGRQEPDFMTEVGQYPDGLIIDPAHHKMYWACNSSKQLAWSSLDAPQAHFTSVPMPPAAVEVDTIHRVMYFGDWQSDLIRQVDLIDGVPHAYNPERANALPAGSASPGVLKLVTILEE